MLAPAEPPVNPWRWCYMKKAAKKWPKSLFYMVARSGFEPPTPSLWVMCSNQLSYLARNIHRANWAVIRRRVFWRFGLLLSSRDVDDYPRRLIENSNLLWKNRFWSNFSLNFIKYISLNLQNKLSKCMVRFTPKQLSLATVAILGQFILVIINWEGGLWGG